MNSLKCPYCEKDLCIEVEVSNLFEYRILDQIEVILKDGTISPPTFIISAPTDMPGTKQNHIIRCTVCSRRFYEAGVGLKIDPTHNHVVLPNFSYNNLRSYDLAIVPKIEKRDTFVLKQRPKQAQEV